MNCFSGTKLDWIHENSVYNITNALTSVVYAFGLFDKEPDQNAWPFFTKEVYYIGMSGGLMENYCVDKKTETRHRLESLVHKRMKDHKSKEEGKIKHSWVKEQTDSGKQLYISFILPPENLNVSMIRNWLSMVESEQILTYQQIYGELPLLNLAERNSNPRVNEESFSQKTLKKIKEVNLDRFLVHE